jgi:hypothetical protein
MASEKTTLTIRPDAELRHRLEKYANDRGISLTAAINIALYEMLGKNSVAKKGA